jgi:hypothetical protein
MKLTAYGRFIFCVKNIYKSTCNAYKWTYNVTHELSNGAKRSGDYIMKNAAYIIKNNSVIATVNTDLKNGTVVDYAFKSCKNALDANRHRSLVNAKSGKISRAKKFDKVFCDTCGVEVNEGEFLL